MRPGPLAAAVAAALIASPAAAEPSPYARPVPPPDPVAQLAEMVALYEAICLRAFPDDAAVARAMLDRGGARLEDKELRRYLHQDPGTGWSLAGRSARFAVTVEAPPYHACGIRTVTSAGFSDLNPYRALADRYEAGGGYDKLPPLPMTVENVDTVGGGEARKRADGTGEALLVFTSTPVAAIRARGEDAVEVRFVHQLVRPGTH
jgi:hypothetical protein